MKLVWERGGVARLAVWGRLVLLLCVAASIALGAILWTSGQTAPAPPGASTAEASSAPPSEGVVVGYREP